MRFSRGRRGRGSSFRRGRKSFSRGRRGSVGRRSGGLRQRIGFRM